MDELEAKEMLRFAERASAGLDGLDRQALFAELEERHNDLVAAMQSFLDGGRTEEALRLANALARFWTASGRLEEGARWFELALAAPGSEDAIRGRAFFEAGLIEFWRGMDDQASDFERQALEIGRLAGEATVTAQALTGLARIALRTNQLDEAQRLCHEALTISESSATPIGRTGRCTYSASPPKWLAGSTTPSDT
jgi:predicted ATPase